MPAGGCYYLRGFSHTGPDFDCTLRALQKVGQVAKGGVFTPSVLFEYLPISKINSVNTSATAFRRQTAPNVLVMLKWAGSAPEKTYEARGIVTEIADIFASSQDGLSDSEKLGYVNYGHGTFLFYLSDENVRTERAPIIVQILTLSLLFP